MTFLPGERHRARSHPNKPDETGRKHAFEIFWPIRSHFSHSYENYRDLTQ